MLHGINGKLDNAEEKASESKTIITNCTNETQEKSGGKRHHQCAGGHRV